MQWKTLCISSSRVPPATWQSKHFVGVSSSGCIQVADLGLQVDNMGGFYCFVLQSSSSYMVQTNWTPLHFFGVKVL